ESAGGVRAFGRLALFDHYRTIAQRVRQEIETFLTDDALMQAEGATKLGLRTNRPRAYIVAGLAGGTGSGMFIDLAYLVHHELRTPAGRTADEGRDVYRNAYPVQVPACQTFGLFRLSWPRPEVLSAATRRFAQRQLQRWTGKEAGHLREHIAEWLTTQWSE